MTQQIIESPYSSKGYEQVTVTSAAGLTVPAGAIFAYLSADSDPIRWRDDGTDPTATVGTLLRKTDPPFLFRGDLSAIRFIDDGSTTSKLSVSYVGYTGH